MWATTGLSVRTGLQVFNGPLLVETYISVKKYDPDKAQHMGYKCEGVGYVRDFCVQPLNAYQSAHHHNNDGVHHRKKADHSVVHLFRVVVCAQTEVIARTYTTATYRLTVRVFMLALL